MKPPKIIGELYNLPNCLNKAGHFILTHLHHIFLIEHIIILNSNKFINFVNFTIQKIFEKLLTYEKFHKPPHLEVL